MHFTWNNKKEAQNIAKHGVSFDEATQAFIDDSRIITLDVLHSDNEQRFFCFGKTPRGVLTVRFTIRDNRIRIIGAGYWRKGRKLYEQENNLY